MQTYTIWAHSPLTNHTERLLDLANINTALMDATLAQRMADSFADNNNRIQKENATDWVGVIKLEEVGIQTLNGYLFHTNV